MNKDLGFRKSIEHIPLIRKFAVTFFFMSVVPIIVFGYVLQQQTGKGIDNKAMLLIVFSMGLGVLAGFLSMRHSILQIHKIASKNTQSLSKSIPELTEKQSNESEVAQLTRTFSEVTQNLENNIKRLESSKRTMQYVLSKLATGISSLRTLDTFLELIVEITTNGLDAETGILMLLDSEKNELYVKTATGLSDMYRSTRIKIGEEMPGWVAQHKKPILIPQPLQIASPQKLPLRPPLLSAPMLYKEKLIGVLTVAGKINGNCFEEDELLIISNLASQTAIAVENERLHLDAERTYIETISALAMAVEARDPYSRGHSDRVAQYSVKIAKALGLPSEQVEEIKVAAELHDVGKIGISDDVLKKLGPLNEEEWCVMHKHPIIGEGIIKPVTSLAKLCSIVRHHHEWVDGIGYPDGLKGQEIPLGSKILAVADSFDAMTSDRPYRKALSPEAAKQDLKKYIDIRYQKEVVEAFLSLV